MIKRGGSGQGAVANAWIMIQDQRAKAMVTWAMVRRVRSGFIETWLVDKNKGGKCVIVSLWLITSPVVTYVMAPTNLIYIYIQRTVTNDGTSLLCSRCAVPQILRSWRPILNKIVKIGTTIIITCAIL